MTGETYDVGSRLRALMVAGDLAALRAHLDGLDRDGLKAARRWASGTHDVDDYPGPVELGDTKDPDTFGRWRQMRRGRLLTHARLGGPVAAVKAAAAEISFHDNGDHPELVAAFVDHDGDWAQAFATAADAVGPSARGASTVFLLLKAVVTAHDLPVPTGRLFHESWIRSLLIPPRESGESPALWLRQDPLLPDVVHHQLASGEVGREPDFPRALQPLVDEGLLDRERILALALEQLTAGQRPTSQKVLVGVLTALDLRPEEVPGGLDYLTSVLSSCHGSAAAPVLRLAIDLVRSGDDATRLAQVLAPRSEKGLRRTLLAALSPEDLGTRVDHAALLDALEVLAAGDQDVADLARYDGARAALGAAPAGDVPVVQEPLGLWDLAPTALEERSDVLRMLTARDLAKQLMRAADKSWGKQVPAQVVLDSLARGDLTTSGLLAVAHELVAEGRLSPPRSANLFEELFLGGAMRLVWPAALHTADLAAAGKRPLPGLDRLLAMLSSYASEPPRPVPLPRHLARLARGTSKAALEAARLARLLGSSTEDVEPVAPDLALWDESTEHPPQALAHPPFRDLESLGRRLAAGPGPGQYYSDPRGRVRRSLALEEIAALVIEHGVDVVRARAADRVTQHSWPLAQAVSLWSAGLLDVSSYWRMVDSTETVIDKSHEWKVERDAYHLWRPIEGLRLDPLVMPSWWAEDEDALEFLHTCEVLLLAERGVPPVSTPDVVDGTLGLDVLCQRLAGAPTLGPIDLRLAVARLRPTDPTDSTRVVGSVRTDPALTTPGGDEGLDAAGLVRTWVAEGGVQCSRSLDEWDQPVFRTGSPWPWTSLAALSGRDLTDLPRFRHHDVWRLPGRPDVWLRGGLTLNPQHDGLADVGGILGADGWRAVFAELAAVPPDYTAIDFDALVRLQRQGRLDPATAAATAAEEWDAGTSGLLGDGVSWEHAFLRGALRGMWPVAVAVVEAALARPERPGGVDALLDVLRRYAQHVPPDAVPAWMADA